MIAANIALTLMVGAAISLSVWKYSPPTWTAMQAAGICLLAVGYVFWTIARFQLGKSLTVSAQARQLVTGGLYSRIRNPIYVFGSCVIAGLILVMGRPVWLLVFLALIPLQIWRARKESSVLEATFGEQYRQYCATTWF